MELKPGQKFKWLELPERWNYALRSDGPRVCQTYEILKQSEDFSRPPNNLPNWYDVKDVTTSQGKYRLGTSDDKFELVTDWHVQDIGQGWWEAVRESDSRRVISKDKYRLNQFMDDADNETEPEEFKGVAEDLQREVNRLKEGNLELTKRVDQAEGNVTRLEKEIQSRMSKYAELEKKYSAEFKENIKCRSEWGRLTGVCWSALEDNNVDSARRAMEASTTAPKGRRIGMKKYLIMFTLGALTGGNIGNLADLGYAIRDHFSGSDTIVTGAFESLPTCNDCDTLFGADEAVAICGKCGSQDIGQTIVAPLYRDRGFPLTDVRVGLQYREANGDTKIVLTAGEEITVENEA